MYVCVCVVMGETGEAGRGRCTRTLMRPCRFVYAFDTVTWEWNFTPCAFANVRQTGRVGSPGGVEGGWGGEEASRQ